MATKKSHLLGLPMQMMLGLALGVVVGMVVSSATIWTTPSFATSVPA